MAKTAEAGRFYNTFMINLDNNNPHHPSVFISRTNAKQTVQHTYCTQHQACERDVTQNCTCSSDFHS